ncbi:MAG: hypothetical protein CL467_01585 [Acidimicrobiaceae bacterium]|nr:hypothetical protein [Acidimicrobiaceae bacterium]|tara:strand:+ start:872 stop:1420 length:549 start_codon:yes stop_codon:yes gene_type:complete
MTTIPESADLATADTNQTPEDVVLKRARQYALSRQEAERLCRDRVLATEEERLAGCDLHAVSNDRFAVNLEADGRTVGFTGTTRVPSGDGPIDRETGAASHRYQVLLEARERLDVLCDRAVRQADEAHEALISATIALAVHAKESENDYCNDEEFDLLAGGGVDPKAATYEKEDTEIGTSAA